MLFFPKRMVQIAVFVAGLVFFAIPSLSQSFSFPVIKTINVDIQPFGATLTPDGTEVWVANSGSFSNNGNKVTIIDVASLTEEPNKITVGSVPEDIAFTSDGQKAFVTNSTDGTVSVIDAPTRTVTQTVSLANLHLAFPFGLVLTNNDKRVFVTAVEGVAELNNEDRSNVTAIRSIAVPFVSTEDEPGRPALRHAGNELLVGTTDPTTLSPELVVIDPETHEIVHDLLLTSNTTSGPQDIAVTPDGRFAYISMFDFSTGPGGVWVVDLLHFSTVTVINTGDPGVFGTGITPDGRFVLATNFLKNQVVAIATSTNTIVATIPVGRLPNKVAVTLDSSEAFVTNQGDTTVSVISIPRD